MPLSTGDRDLCRIGGMVGHNASGYRSVKYGQTIDHVVSLRVALADGGILVARDLRVDGSDWAEAVRIAPALPPVRREIEGHREAILASRLSIRKHSCGYQLVRIVEALQRGVFPLAELFVGSEGTLGVVTEVTLRVIPVPPERITILLYLDRFQELGPLVADLLRLGPSAMEAIDGASLDLIGREPHGAPANAEAMLLVEFDEAVLTRFQGAPSGEHGIGRLRAETLPRIWGADVYGVMRSIKDAFDPRGLLNPGVLFSDEPWWASWGGLESRVPM